MNARHSLLALFAAVALLPSALPSVARAQTASPQRYEEKKREANDIAVSIVVSGLSCTCARFAQLPSPSTYRRPVVAARITGH